MGYTTEKDLPLRWDGKTKENLLWKVPLDGIGNSSPIVWGERVFVTVSAKQTNKESDAKIIPEHWVSSFQVADGKELWRTSVKPGSYPRGYGIYAVPTPATDGQRVYCWFGSGVMAALDFDGKIVWRIELPGELPKRFDGMINSPILFEDTVIRIVNADQAGGNGAIEALDKATGKLKWEKKLTKSASANASPIVLPIQGKPQLIAATGNNSLEGLNPADGTTILSVKRHMGVLSPVYASGLLFTDCPGGPGVAIDPTGKGDLTKTHAKWKIDKTPASYAYASPGISGDYIYRVHKPGILHCWKLSTGELLHRRLEGLTNLASPVSSPEERVYFLSSAISYVIKAGPKPEVLAKNDLGGYTGNNGPSPAIANGRIYVRDAAPAGAGQAYLYCIGKK